MIGQGVSILNGERIKGFVKLELFDKAGNKKLEKENLIVPGGKTLMFAMSASNILINGGNMWGLTAKQGAHIIGPIVTSGSMYYRGSYKDSALTNILLNLTPEQLESFSSETNFVNMYSDDLGSADKVVAYANMELYPTENGKIGTPDFSKGSDIIGRTVNSVRFRYKDGVGTGRINAVCMGPFSTTQSPYGLAGLYEQSAPGYRIAKCLDRVNILDTNFSSLTSKYTPAGVAGITTEEEIITNYKVNDVEWHKINLNTGEITDLTDTNTLYGIIDADTLDYKIIDDYIYVLKSSGGTNSINNYIYVYKISTAEMVKRFSVISAYTGNAKLLYKNGELFLTLAGYNTNAYNLIHKLGKGTYDYFNVVDTKTDTYAGITEIPAGINEKFVCLGNYGDNYIMYISRAITGTDCKYCTAYIFTDMNNIAGSIKDCIPSLRYTDIVFNTTQAKGVLSLGICRETSQYYDGYQNNRIYISNGSDTKTQEFNIKGLFYSPDKSWSNIVSIVKLEGDDVIEKGEQDVLLVTYGYRIV